MKLLTRRLTICGRGLSLMNSSMRSHLSVAQIGRQHLLHLGQLLRLHTHRRSEQPVADSQVVHLTREVVLLTKIRRRKQNN